jgi:hypothetical protein
MASTKEMQLRARLRKKTKQGLHSLVQECAQRSGYRGIDMSGSSKFMNAATNISINTSNNSQARADALYRLFVDAAMSAGGSKAAEEMRQVLNEALPEMFSGQPVA